METAKLALDSAHVINDTLEQLKYCILEKQDLLQKFRNFNTFIEVMYAPTLRSYKRTFKILLKLKR